MWCSGGLQQTKQAARPTPAPPSHLLPAVQDGHGSGPRQPGHRQPRRGRGTGGCGAGKGARRAGALALQLQLRGCGAAARAGRCLGQGTSGVRSRAIPLLARSCKSAVSWPLYFVQPVLDEAREQQAFWLWKWATDEGMQASGLVTRSIWPSCPSCRLYPSAGPSTRKLLPSLTRLRPPTQNKSKAQVSRDEVREAVQAGSLPPQLQAVSERRGAQQAAVRALVAAAAAGDVAGAQVRELAGGSIRQVHADTFGTRRRPPCPCCCFSVFEQLSSICFPLRTPRSLSRCPAGAGGAASGPAG